MILHCFVYQHLQEDPEQVAADEAAAAERLDLSRYTDYRTWCYLRQKIWK